MNNEANKIRCPNCGEDIDVNEILYHQLDEEIKKKYNDQIARERRQLESKAEKLREEQAAVAQDRQNYDEQLSEAITSGVKAERKQLEQSIKTQAREEQEERVAALRKELNEKSEQVKELNKSKAEIEKLRREKDELGDKFELEAQQKINETLKSEKEKIRKAEAEKAQLNVSEKEQIINQLKEQLAEAQRKADQGSMQLQGEVQELAIEEWLSAQFPLDTVDEIKKGERGADCLQTVHTHHRRNCGTIYYESKRTKSFQPAWIEKFKTDIRDKNADIGVLVTEAMPADMERIGLRDGVWVCSFNEFKGLCAVLRESVITISSAIATQENRGDKMSVLYSYLTSNEFRLQIEAIVEGFTQMEADLKSEKRAMEGIWKKRQKQIDKVLTNTTGMYGAIKGIAGNAVQSVPQLELGGGSDDD
ncbi:MAG: DUF2130 domain-containing protein [Salinispira sp.]